MNAFEDSSWIGRQLGQYRILSTLGRGGMGIVFKAEDTRPDLRRLGALQFLAPQFSDNRHAVERFKREALLASSANHPHICVVYDISFDANTMSHYIVMEYLEGQTLRERLKQSPIDFEQVLELS